MSAYCIFCDMTLHFGMPYNLKELNAFLTIVDFGTLGKAAEQLNITQPALSRIVKRLETAIGEPLFERHSGGMRITSYGKALLPHARLLRQEEKLARDEIQRMRGMATGVLRIGVTAGVSAFFLPRAIGVFLDRWPGIAIEVVEGLWDEMTDALSGYQVDLLLAPEAHETESIAAAKQCQWAETMSVVVGTRHPLRNMAAVSMQDLIDQRWCFVPHAAEPHKRLATLFEKRGLAPPPVALTSTSIPLLKSLVAHSGFISWLTAPMYASEKKAGMLHELAVDGLDLTRHFHAYHRRNGILPKPAVRFLEEVRQLASEALQEPRSGLSMAR